MEQGSLGPLPPLRARRDDVPALAQRFLAQAARRLGVAPKRFAPDAVQRLLAHDWPGNVRELENLCWRLAALAPGERVLAADLPFDARPADTHASTESIDWEQALRRWADAELAAGHAGLHGDAAQRMERVLFEAALAATGGHRQQAAAKLGLGRNTLTRKLRGK